MCRLSEAHLRTGSSCFAVIAAIAGLAFATAASAQLTGDASATAHVEHNSNVFDLYSGTPQGTVGNSRGGDTYYAYGAQFHANYAWGLQDLYATASSTEFDYQHLTQLDHNEYQLDAGWIWRLGPLLDGKLDVSRFRLMVPFFNLDQTGLLQTELSIQTEQRETAMAGLTISPEWRVEGTAYTRKLEEPLEVAPNLQLTETSGTASLKYLGVSKLTSGIFAGYETGDYQGVGETINPSYHQSVAGLLADYHTARTTVESQIGYTRRISATGFNSNEGTTGQFRFNDQLTPKTSVNVTFSRVINSYVANAGSEIDTGAGAGVEWQATPKLNVAVEYIYTNRKFPDQGNDPLGSDRIDHQQNATLNISYRPRRWLLIKPYANVLTRSSNYIGGEFNATIYGVYVTVLTPRVVDKTALK